MGKNENLKGDLSIIVGKENVSDNIFDRISYAQDSTRLLDIRTEVIPLAVVKPRTSQQVSEIVKYANQERIPIHIQGAATTFKGAARPKRPGNIILNTENLNSLEVNEDDQYCEVGAGINQYVLEQKLADLGYFLPMNVASKFSSTVGGAVAVNTIGHLVDDCLGKISDYVMGVEAVLPTGAIVETGTRSIRRPAGIDYTRFFVGCEGLFGIMTKLRLRLVPAFKQAFIVAFFRELTDLGHGYMAIYKQKLPPPLYGEFVDIDACKPLFKQKKLGEPQGHMALAITIGQTQEEADRRAEEVIKVFYAESAVEARIVTSIHEQEAYQDTRDHVGSVVQEPIEGQYMVNAASMSVAVPLGHLSDVIVELKSGYKQRYKALGEAKPFVLGHVGTADIHGMYLCPRTWELSKRLECAKEATALENEINFRWGCVSGEVGQTGTRLGFLRKRYGEDAYAMLLSMKRVLDPNNILNAGNIEGEL